MRRPERGGEHLVMVVEEAPGLADDICRTLEAAGYHCCQAADEERLLMMAGQRSPDLVLLDHNGPVNQCRNLIMRLKQDSITAGIPVVVLVPNASTTEELIAFALGADECLSRVVSGRVLAARVAALLRRVRFANQSCREVSEVRMGPLHVDQAARRAEVDGESIYLTPTEFRLLWSVAANRDRVTRRGDLLKTIFGTSDQSDRRIDVHMASLRKKLGRAGGWVQTVRGVGFACRPPRV